MPTFRRACNLLLPLTYSTLKYYYYGVANCLLKNRTAPDLEFCIEVKNVVLYYQRSSCYVTKELTRVWWYKIHSGPGFHPNWKKYGTVTKISVCYWKCWSKLLNDQWDTITLLCLCFYKNANLFWPIESAVRVAKICLQSYFYRHGWHVTVQTSGVWKIKNHHRSVENNRKINRNILVIIMILNIQMLTFKSRASCDYFGNPCYWQCTFA